LDNDEAQKREGCDPTYKKVRGFQPLQLIWEGKIVDAIFRRGKRHSNYGTDVAKIVRKIVTLIRSRYDASVSIILRLDAGFSDEKNFALCDELHIGFIATGTTTESKSGVMPVSPTSVRSGPKLTAPCPPVRNTKTSSECSSLPAQTTSF